MKLFTLLFFFLMTAQAQIKPVDQQYMNGENYLLNAGFESGRTSWTESGTATDTLEQSIVRFGLQSLKIVSSAQTVNLSQVITKYAAQSSGQQGIASAWIKSTSAISQVCAVADSVDTKCVTIEANNTWKEYVIPFIMGSTNNGIRVKSTSDSATTYIDNAFVGVMPATMMPNVENITEWQPYTPTFTGFGTATNIEFQWRQVGSGIEIRGKFTSGTSTATEARISLPNNLVSAGTSTIPSIQLAGKAAIDANSTTYFNSAVLIEPSVGYLTLSRQSSSAHELTKALGSNFAATSQVVSLFASVPIANLGAFSKIYSGDTIYPHAQLYGTLTYAAIANCTWSVTSTSFINFPADTDCPTPTVTGNLIAPATKIPAFVLPAGAPKGTYKIVSRGGFGGGASGGRLQYLRFSDGTNVTTSGIIYMSNTIANLPEASGQFTYDSPLIANTTIQAQGSSSSGAMDIYNGSTGSMALTFEVYYFPPKDNPIIGTFEGIEKCSDAYECTDVFSAKVSGAGVVSDENLNWINGNCTLSTTTFSCTFNTSIFTVAPNCTISPIRSGNSWDYYPQIVTNSSTTLSWIYANTNSGATASALPTNITCQKQGSDYKPKTAKAATTNEMMYVPNVTRPKTCYYAFGGASATLASPTVCAASPCVEVYDSCSAGTAPTRSAAGNYQDLTFANGTWKSNTFITCKCSSHGTTSSQDRYCISYFVTSDQTWMTNSSGGAVLNFFSTNGTGSGADTYTSVECTGDAP